MANRKEIRNSTAEFLIFQIEGKEQGVEVFYKDKTVWCTQKAMGMLFDVNIPAISKHLKNIYEQGKLTEERTVSRMEIVRMEGNRQVKRETVFYNLDCRRLQSGCTDHTIILQDDAEQDALCCSWTYSRRTDSRTS